MTKPIRVPEMPPDPPKIHFAGDGQSSQQTKPYHAKTLTSDELRWESERDLMRRLREANAVTTKLPQPNDVFTYDELGMSPKEFESLRPERRLHLANLAKAKRTAQQ